MDADLVERVGRALGVWRMSAAATAVMSATRPLLIEKLQAGGLRVWTWSESGVDHRTVDIGTMLVMLLGLGRRVDIGECPACRERGGPWVWEWALTRTCERRVERCGGELGAYVWVGTVRGRATRTPCPTCTVDGEPTGRRTVTWEQAVLDATPRPGQPGSLASVLDIPVYSPDARAALHVLADRLQGDGDPRGTILTAWLRGPCGECDDGVALVDMGSELVFDAECPKCRGRGTVLGALADLVRTEAVRVAEAGELAVWESLDASARSALGALAQGARVCDITIGNELHLAGAGLFTLASGITTFGRRVAEAGRRALASAEASP